MGLGERLRLTGGAHSPAGVKAGLCPSGWKPDTLMCLSLRPDSCLCSHFRQLSHVSPRSQCGKHEEGRGSGWEGVAPSPTPLKKDNRPVCLGASPPDVSGASGGWEVVNSGASRTRETPADWMSLYIHQSSAGTKASCPLRDTINNWQQTELLFIICKTCFWAPYVPFPLLPLPCKQNNVFFYEQ